MKLWQLGGNDFGETSLSHLEDQLPLDSSDCCTQTIWAQAQRLSFSPLVCRLRQSSEVSHLLTWAKAWNPNFSPWNISYVPRRFENVFGASTLNRLTEQSRSYQNVYVRCSQHPQTTFGVQHTERCIKDISFLLSAQSLLSTFNYIFSRNISKTIELKRELRHNLQKVFWLCSG